MLELNNENFEQKVLNYTEKPVLIDFWGEKCEKCLQLMPEYEKLAEKYMEQVSFCSLNTTAYRKLAIGQRVLGLPTFIFYINGEKKEVLTPNKINSISDIEQIITEYLNA